MKSLENIAYFGGIQAHSLPLNEPLLYKLRYEEVNSSTAILSYQENLTKVFTFTGT